MSEDGGRPAVKRYVRPRRCQLTWWQPPPSKRVARAIPVRRVRFPSTSATPVALACIGGAIATGMHARTCPPVATPPFDAVLFDAGGVLVVPDTTVLGPVVARFGGTTDREALVRAHFAGSHALDQAGGDEEDWLAYHRGYAAACAVDEGRLDEAAAALLDTLRHAHWREPFPGALEVLAALDRRGVPIGVVSNAAGQVEAMLVTEGLCQVGGGGAVPVRCVVDSHVVGVAKPDPAIFDHALPLLGVAAGERIASVGDPVFNDVRAADAAGLTPLLHDPYGFHAASGAVARTVRDLAELLDLVP